MTTRTCLIWIGGGVGAYCAVAVGLAIGLSLANQPQSLSVSTPALTIQQVLADADKLNGKTITIRGLVYVFPGVQTGSGQPCDGVIVQSKSDLGSIPAMIQSEVIGLHYGNRPSLRHGDTVTVTGVLVKSKRMYGEVEHEGYVYDLKDCK